MTALEPLPQITVHAPPGLDVHVDADALEQALINLAKNAMEAQCDGEGHVLIEAQTRGTDLVLTITDRGAGIANTDNLFVPFFTHQARRQWGRARPVAPDR